MEIIKTESLLWPCALHASTAWRHKRSAVSGYWKVHLRTHVSKASMNVGCGCQGNSGRFHHLNKHASVPHPLLLPAFHAYMQIDAYEQYVLQMIVGLSSHPCRTFNDVTRVHGTWWSKWKWIIKWKLINANSTFITSRNYTINSTTVTYLRSLLHSTAESTR